MREDIQQEQADHAQSVIQNFEVARKRRTYWEGLWQDTYDYALPQRGNFLFSSSPGERKGQKVYDATAMDAADQLAASLLGNLTPTWSQWFGLKPGTEIEDEDAKKLAPILDKAAKVIQDHFDRSNLAVEIHQCYLDLVVGGTASLYFQEADPGEFSAFKFSAMPLSQIAFEEGEGGYLDSTYRMAKMTLETLRKRYPSAEIPSKVIQDGLKDPHEKFTVLEAIKPNGLSFEYSAILNEEGVPETALMRSQFDTSPFINFRWIKSPGEIYGRSPVMKALPDIKTANKVVELILKNASIAVTGIWQADDDGVLNPANIELKPGTIIPKAIGSKGLQALDMPGRFDISEIVLERLQSRIRHALLADRLAPINSARMSATEVLERSAEMSLLLGATYGRLQTELLTPLIKRAFAILRRRGEIPDISLDGRHVAIEYKSPLALSQGQRNVQNTLGWINSVLGMGAEASSTIDLKAAAQYLGETMGVPGNLILREDDTDLTQVVPAIAEALEQAGVTAETGDSINA